MSVTEDYCSFEIAKLLKEKGFDWEESPFYSEQDRDEWWQNNNYTIPNTSYNPDLPFDSETITLIAPHVSLQMAMKWLREVHNLHICIFIGEDSSCDTDGNTVDMWHFWSYNVTNLCGDMVYDAYDKFDCVEYQSYEGAVEAAIKYCLTNLI